MKNASHNLVSNASQLWSKTAFYRYTPRSPLPCFTVYASIAETVLEIKICEVECEIEAERVVAGLNEALERGTIQLTGKL